MKDLILKTLARGILITLALVIATLFIYAIIKAEIIIYALGTIGTIVLGGWAISYLVYNNNDCGC